jgi:hypothetical protein
LSLLIVASSLLFALLFPSLLPLMPLLALGVTDWELLALMVLNLVVAGEADY